LEVEERFSSGSHLMVLRRFGYYHHGIYLGHGKVAQFGGGISDKPRARIGVVSLEAFEGEGRCSVVDAVMARNKWSRFYRNPDPPEIVVARALWLVDNYPRGRYNLLGNNCETMAVFCKSGVRPETLQGRGAVTALNLLFWIFYDRLAPRLERSGRITHRQRQIAQGVLFGVAISAHVVYLGARFRFIWFMKRHYPGFEDRLNDRDDLPSQAEIGGIAAR
jgi:Lecithin retinol acyltransferase